MNSSHSKIYTTINHSKHPRYLQRGENFGFDAFTIMFTGSHAGQRGIAPEKLITTGIDVRRLTLFLYYM